MSLSLSGRLSQSLVMIIFFCGWVNFGLPLLYLWHHVHFFLVLDYLFTWFGLVWFILVTRLLRLVLGYLDLTAPFNYCFARTDSYE